MVLVQDFKHERILSLSYYLIIWSISYFISFIIYFHMVIKSYIVSITTRPPHRHVLSFFQWFILKYMKVPFDVAADPAATISLMKLDVELNNDPSSGSNRFHLCAVVFLRKTHPHPAQ